MSRNREKIQEDLAELRLNFNTPITIQRMRYDFKESFSKFRTESVDLQEALKNYLYSVSDMFFKALHLDNITNETERLCGLIQDIRAEKYIKFDIFENGDYKEANKLIKDIYTKWNDVQLRKEICSDHISLIKKAIVYLTSLKKVITVFISDSGVHGVTFKKVSDLKQYIDLIVISIESYIDILKSQISEISAWLDNVLSPKINMLMRADSSLRLLAKYSDWDYSNRCGTTEPQGFKDEEPKPGEFSGFGNF